jgi:hypothetical protein
MKLSASLGAAIAATILALVLLLRMTQIHQGFQKMVLQSLVTSEGYDQNFINLVNHLEDVLATRASFSYLGGKDPMTGRQREVAKPEAVRAPVRRIPNAGLPDKPAPDAAPAAPSDPFRLTALIADDFGRYTAIVMDGERSVSVDVGDQVGGKKVARITNREITMETGSSIITYGLDGTRSVTPK